MYFLDYEWYKLICSLFIQLYMYRKLAKNKESGSIRYDAEFTDTKHFRYLSELKISIES